MGSETDCAIAVLDGWLAQGFMLSAKGADSWKARATGIEALHGNGDVLPLWTPTFEASDYRQFHDAVKEHRIVVTQQAFQQRACDAPEGGAVARDTFVQRRRGGTPDD